MKQWYLLIIILSFIGCNDDDKEREYQAINIEKKYPYLYEKHSIENIDTNAHDFFNQKIFLINSVTQLNENPLFIYCPDILKEEFSKCDFDKYSLIMASSSMLSEVTDIKYNLEYNNIFLHYEYNQTIYSKPLAEPIENIFFVLNAFLIKKIQEDSEIIFTKAFIVSHGSTQNN